MFKLQEGSCLEHIEQLLQKSASSSCRESNVNIKSLKWAMSTYLLAVKHIHSPNKLTFKLRRYFSNDKNRAFLLENSGYNTRVT